MIIKIKKSSTADTRTCDWSKVTKGQLESSSLQHIGDVIDGLSFFAVEILKAASQHDHTKLSGIDHFHADFSCGFKTTGWFDNHRKVERHHLEEDDGIPLDVNLIDVLEFITDCVMSGKARSGRVKDLTISDKTLRDAFENTWRLLDSRVEVEG